MGFLILNGNIKKIISFIFLVKPLVDLTSLTSLNIGGVELSALKIQAVLFFIVLFMKVITNFKNIILTTNSKFIIFFCWYIFISFLFKIFYFNGNPFSFHFNNLIMLIRLYDVMFLFLCIPLFIKNYDDIKKLMLYGWIGNFSVMVINIIIYILGNYTTDISQGVERFNSLYNDPGGPSFVAFCCLIISTIYYTVALKSEKVGGIKYKHILWFLLLSTHLFALFTINITMTRAVMLSFLIFYFMWFVYYQKKFFTMVPLFILIIVYMLTSNEGISQRFGREIDFIISNERDIELAMHMGGGRVAHNIMLFNWYLENYSIPSYLFGYRSFGVHNEYLSFLFNFGILGLIFYLATILKFFRAININSGINKTNVFGSTFGKMSVIIILVWIQTAITGNFFQYTTLLWYMITIIGISVKIKF